MGEDGQRFPLAVFADQPVMVTLSLFVVTQEQTGCLGESPFEMNIADFAVFGGKLFSTGFPGAFNQTTVGDKVLDPIKAANVMGFVQDDQA